MSYTVKQTGVIEVEYIGFDGYPSKAWWVESARDPGWWSLEGSPAHAVDETTLDWQLEIFQALRDHLDTPTSA